MLQNFLSQRDKILYCPRQIHSRLKHSNNKTTALYPPPSTRSILPRLNIQNVFIVFVCVLFVVCWAVISQFGS